MKKGFTLVELSIVLVIIGLLIGGILVAQSMISTAKTEKLISLMSQYVVAGRNFKTTYGYWPGDYPKDDFGCAGNGDGIMTYGNYMTTCTAANGSGQVEGASYFVHLSKAGFLSQALDYNDYATTQKYMLPDITVPSGPDKNSQFYMDSPQVDWNGLAYATGAAAIVSYSYPIGTNFLWYSKKYLDGSCSQNAAFVGNILTPADAAAIDAKADDGIPGTGNIIATSSCQGNDEPAVDSRCVPDYSNPQNNSGYVVTNPAHTCIIGLRVTD